MDLKLVCSKKNYSLTEPLTVVAPKPEDIIQAFFPFFFSLIAKDANDKYLIEISA